MRIAAILTVRDEAAFLLEWLAHHQTIGFTDFVVLSNDCRDGTDTMLDRLQALGQVHHIRNNGPHDKRGIQFTGLNLAAKHPAIRKADWILPLDIDEFVNIHAGEGSVADLLEALPDATAITLTWRLFGNAGKLRFEDAPVLENFTRCAPELVYWPWRAAMFKTLYRNDGTYRKPGVHRPRQLVSDRVEAARWFDGHGRELDPQFRERRIFSPFGRENFGLAQLNHYPLGAMESFVLKADRGRAVHSDHMLDVDYWVERNFNTHEDRSILRFSPARDKRRADLMADPEIARLHAAAVGWRKARFETLMTQEPFRALFARLMMTPPSRPVDARSAQTLMRYAALGRANGEAGRENDPKPA
ncbi:glycosyltransferase family 2 protein [Lutimaribacter marinistellae]|uniref:Glycosyltransferase family 2 protein n=1 Tax=Lutimaribacter marinistellae TaxID=1820329 RepID=A0ABV7TM65_9RHOB